MAWRSSITRGCLFAAASAAIVGLSGGASAQPAAVASLNNVQGAVFVDGGNGFTPVAGPIELRVGDRVMVAAGGSAHVIFQGDCTVSLQPDSMVTIPEVSPCPIGEVGSSPEVPGVVAGDGTGLSGLSVVALGVGAAALIAGGVILIADDDDDDRTDRPVSP